MQYSCQQAAYQHHHMRCAVLCFAALQVSLPSAVLLALMVVKVEVLLSCLT